MKRSKLISVVLCLVIALTMTGCKSSSVKKCERMISAIGSVSIDSSSDIEMALNAYEDLTLEEKSQVGNYDDLLAAQVEYVEVLINEIGEVDVDSEDAIDEAREAYDNLASEQRDSVSNYSDLVDAEESYEEITMLDITGTWHGTFMGIDMYYVFNEDGTMYNYTTSSNVNGTASGNFSFDGSYLTFPNGSVSPAVRTSETTLVITATSGSNSFDIVLTRE